MRIPLASLTPALRSAGRAILRRSVITAAAIAAAAGVAGGGAAVAIASHQPVAVSTTSAATPLPSSTPGATPTASAGARSQGRRGLALAAVLIQVTSSTTGQTRKQIVAELRGGQTLDEIAGAQAGPVKSAALARLTTLLDQAVAAGRITKAREAKVLDQAPARIAALMSKALRQGGPHRPAASATPAA